MKSFLKIIFFGIIAGVTCKYLNERGINIIEKGREAYEWAVREGEELSEISDSGSSAQLADSPGLAQSYEPPAHLSVDGNESDKAEEFLISEKECRGTEKFPALDEYARNTPAEAEASLETLTAWLIRPASNDLEKSRLIFTWVATHIHYDDNGYNTGNYSDVAAEPVLRNRVGVCQGFSNLFDELAKQAGLESAIATGYAKGISYSPGDIISGPNHAWNAIKIDGRWRLFDVTWAAGFGRGVNGKLVSSTLFDDYWFDARPDEFIFSHLPEDEQWQLNDVKISKSQFERLPYVSSSFFKLGFNGSNCFHSALNGEIDGFPEAYMVKGDIRMVSMLYDKKIKADKVIKVRIKSDSAVKIAFRNSGLISNMAREGNEFTAIVRTTPGPLCLMANFGGDGGTYETFLEYEVE
jgi:transglutaminase-like putative cysteine protease